MWQLGRTVSRQWVTGRPHLAYLLYCTPCIHCIDYYSCLWDSTQPGRRYYLKGSVKVKNVPYRVGQKVFHRVGLGFSNYEKATRKKSPGPAGESMDGTFYIQIMAYLWQVKVNPLRFWVFTQDWSYNCFGNILTISVLAPVSQSVQKSWGIFPLFSVILEHINITFFKIHAPCRKHS